MRISNLDSPLSQNIFDQIIKGAQVVGDTARRVGTQVDAAMQTKNPLKLAFDNVEIRTTIAAPVRYSADDLWNEVRAPPDPNGVSAFLKPTFEINSALFGKRVFAPYGAAGPREWESFQNKMWLYGLLGVSGLVGLGIFLGYNAAKKQR